ncbi:MAG: phosphate ABC transporter substrate-binding protein [Candidatus Aquicultorales bacterium]
MLKKASTSLFALAVLALVVASFARPNQFKDRVMVAGSTTVLPIAEVAAELYNRENPDGKILVQGGGSSAGIEAAITKTVDIGMSSRDLKPEELAKGLTDIPVAVDAIAIIVNNGNSVDKLTKDQVEQIYGGRITNWKQLGGKDTEIILVNRDEASGTREAFSKMIMRKDKFTKDAVIQPGSGQVRSIVSMTEGAIGYISLGYVTDDVKTIALDGVRPTVESIAAKEYGLMRTLHFLVKGEPQDATKKFIDFILGDKVQNDIVSKEFLSIRVVKEKSPESAY